MDIIDCEKCKKKGLAVPGNGLCQRCDDKNQAKKKKLKSADHARGADDQEVAGGAQQHVSSQSQQPGSETAVDTRKMKKLLLKIEKDVECAVRALLTSRQRTDRAEPCSCDDP